MTSNPSAISRIVIAGSLLAVLSACGGGDSGASAPQSGSPPAAGTPPQATVNSAPQISGQPGATVSVGATYTFTPTATDTNQDPLSFSIANRPAWLTFNIATGQLSGTPTAAHLGTHSNITISVSDGSSTTTLGPFSITVQSPPGTATLTWNAVTENTDGSPLANLAGYWIYHGSDAVNLNRLQQVNSPTTTTASLSGLASGAHFFAISAMSSTGLESPLSNVVRKNIQ